MESLARVELPFSHETIRYRRASEVMIAVLQDRLLHQRLQQPKLKTLELTVSHST